jgi:hypothetical protein
MANDPPPLTQDSLAKLTWEHATERFLAVAELGPQPPLPERLLDGALAAAHQTLTSVEALRVAAGAPVANGANLTAVATCHMLHAVLFF